ncbi:MAG: hypothetical protein GC151_19270 [Betaproteobacteria bacterium]|nr:hypothetical protein [Betaproteobacteria bacterium]
MLGIFDTRKVDDFAKSLAQDFARRFPPANEGRTDKGVTSQYSVVSEAIYGRAIRFHQENRLGLYRKAKLGNTFRWQLKEIGYTDGFIEKLTRGMVVRLAQNKK